MSASTGTGLTTAFDINTPGVRYAISNVLHDMLGAAVPQSRLIEVAAAIFVLMDRASAGEDVSPADGDDPIGVENEVIAVEVEVISTWTPS